MPLAVTSRLPDRRALLALYESVGWTAYTGDAARLEAAVRGSRWVRTVWDGEALIGLARAVGDGETICYLQDVLVHPDFRHQGVGRALMRACLADHEHVRQFALLADDLPELRAFYESAGLARIDQVAQGRLTAFVRLGG